MAEAISGSWQMPRTRRRFSAKGAALLAANSLPTAMSSPAQQEFSRHRGWSRPSSSRWASASLAFIKVWKVCI